VTEPNSIPERVTKLEQQMTDVNRKADDALTLARGADGDVADFRTEMRAQRKVIHALREIQVEQGKKIDALAKEMRDGFRETREGFSKLSVGMAHIAALLGVVLERSGGPPS
jgi:hypothetical protein